MDFIHLLGTATLIFILLLAIGTIATLVLILLSVRANKTYFPGALMFLLSSFESPAKSVLRLFKIDTSIIDRLVIELQNAFFKSKFSATDYKDRALFLPQCLRSTECPAKLSPEGIKCVGCGRCVIKDIKKEAEKKGYRVFVVPGSSFIKRAVVKYQPKAILGVGCQPEIKQSIEICQKFGLPGQGITLSRAGCINTIVDVDDIRIALAMHSQ